MSFLAVLTQNAVGSGTGGTGGGAEDDTAVRLMPRTYEPEIIMIVFPFFIYSSGKACVGGVKLAVYLAKPRVMRRSSM